MRYFLGIMIILFLWACQDVKRPEKPDDLISKEKMVDILTDSYLMNAARSINSRIINERGIKLDSTLYKKYNIDSLQFARSNAYYTSDLNGYTSMFNQVEQRLIQFEKEHDSIKLANTKKAEAEIEAKAKKDSMEVETGLIDPVETDAN